MEDNWNGLVLFIILYMFFSFSSDFYARILHPSCNLYIKDEFVLKSHFAYQ